LEVRIDNGKGDYCGGGVVTDAGYTHVVSGVDTFVAGTAVVVVATVTERLCAALAGAGRVPDCHVEGGR
jgi:hypothetical protein